MRYFFMCVCLAAAACGYAQSAAGADTLADSALPRSYRGVSLGMGLDDLKDALQKDALFGFRGDSDVSFVPVREETNVETTGASFIRRSFFQLNSGRVFVMMFTFNTTLTDYYSVFSALVKKYGEPGVLDPKQAVWEDDAVRVSIERPLTVRYIDKPVFSQLLAESNARKSEAAVIQEEFLNDF
jgi:hypothetical protein